MIPCSGTIKASAINTELGRTPTSIFHLDGADERSLAGKPSGLIKFSDFYCKSMSFNLTIGQEGFSAAGLQFYGFGLSEVVGWNYGYIDGNRPSAVFPSGYGGATSAFYPVILGTNYGNRSGHDVVLYCSSTPNSKNFIFPFGNTVETTWVLPDGTQYTYILPRDGNGYVTQANATVLENALKSNIGKTCKVSLKKI